VIRRRELQVWLLALVLILIGGALTYYKSETLGFPLVPDSSAEVWTVEATLTFEAGAGPIKARMFIPGLTPGFATLDENFVSRGFGATPRYVSGGREVQWARRRAEGQQALYYRSVVYEDASRRGEDTTPPLPSSPLLSEPFNTAAQMIVEEVGRKSADPGSFAGELLRRLGRPEADQNVDLLLDGDNDPVAIAQTATDLLAAALIPSRMVRGIFLQDQVRRAVIAPWLMVHDGTTWLYFDPVTGEQGLPDDFLLWWSGTEDVADVDGGRDVDVRIAVSRNVVDPVNLARQRSEVREGPIANLSLLALPIQTQAVYAVLLLVPIGALVVAILRNVVGVQTFGTFMPVLIALAFRETRLLWGIVLFSTLVALGLAFRFYLDRLRLLAIPRISAVLTIVVLLMLGVSVLGHQFELESGLSVALFPMVILAMTVERMSTVWEERGAADAVQQGVGSLVVAAACYAVMDLEVVRHLVFVFPESLLIVLALTLLVGRYTGYRLSELRRFRELVRTEDSR
jgi:hypothetical protein